MSKKTIVFDFDGVIHKYSNGWQDGSIYDEPVEGIKDVLRQLNDLEYEIVIVSTRCTSYNGISDITDWLRKYDLYQYVNSVSATKPPAYVYVDDRALTFNPANIDHLVDDIVRFKTWQQLDTTSKLF